MSLRFSIILCHYRTGKMTAFSISQILKYKGDHEIEILICNNNAGDGSEKYLEPFKDHIKIFDYPKDKLQSHGIGYDTLFEMASSEWIITLESDSFPIKDNWLDYYVRLINEGYDGAASLLQLSGGLYGHPAGALYRRSNWIAAWQYCRNIDYMYLPNIAMKEGFQCHLMVHRSIWPSFIHTPEDYIELSESYKPYSYEVLYLKAAHYQPVVGPMHNGMGRLQESIRTFGGRNTATEIPNILLDNKAKIIYRIGYEPGQWFHYWLIANGKKIYCIPTETKWILGKEMQQQEYTLNEAGIKHIWAGSSYLSMKDTSQHDVYEFKCNQIEELYNSLPEHQKIKI